MHGLTAQDLRILAALDDVHADPAYDAAGLSLAQLIDMTRLAADVATTSLSRLKALGLIHHSLDEEKHLNAHRWRISDRGRVLTERD